MTETTKTPEAAQAKQNEMTAKPHQHNMTRQPTKTEKDMTPVRIVALQSFQLEKDEDGNYAMSVPGMMYEVPRKKARDLCRKVEGTYAFSGERYNADKDISRHDLTRARLATAADIAPTKDKPLDSLDGADEFDRQVAAQQAGV
jgi:hypothetical protein